MSRASPVYPADLDYDDTWGFVLGVQHAFADRWLSSLGGGYDTSPMSKSDRTPTLPMDRQFRLGTGIQYSFNDDITVGAGLRDADLDRERAPLAGRIQGDYKSNDFHFFNVNLSWRF
jgi:long-chain fatty acid transport protein